MQVAKRAMIMHRWPSVACRFFEASQQPYYESGLRIRASRRQITADRASYGAHACHTRMRLSSVDVIGGVWGPADPATVSSVCRAV